MYLPGPFLTSAAPTRTRRKGLGRGVEGYLLNHSGQSARKLTWKIRRILGWGIRIRIRLFVLTFHSIDSISLDVGLQPVFQPSNVVARFIAHFLRPSYRTLYNISEAVNRTHRRDSLARLGDLQVISTRLPPTIANDPVSRMVRPSKVEAPRDRTPNTKIERVSP